MDNHSGVPSDDLTGDAGNMTEEDLAAALGEELPKEEAPEPTAEALEPEAPQFVHEPTGKQFDSEMELLRYESGWKDNKYGNELKEVKAKLEAYEKLLEGAGNEPAQQQQVDPAKQEQILLERALQGTGVNLEEVDPGAYKTIFKMMENMLGMYDTGVASKRYQELQGTVEKITTRAQEAEALNNAGVSIDQVQEVLEKYPQLKALPPTDRVAVIADLTKAQEAKQAAPETGNALRQALQPKSADHVEGSVGTQKVDEGEEGTMREMEAQLTGDDRDFLRQLGAATAAAGPTPWEHD
jgi:hypothetical protein